MVRQTCVDIVKALCRDCVDRGDRGRKTFRERHKRNRHMGYFRQSVMKNARVFAGSRNAIIRPFRL